MNLRQRRQQLFATVVLLGVISTTVSRMQPGAEAAACSKVSTLGEHLDLPPGTATSGVALQLGCISFNQHTTQGPLLWYRGVFLIEARVASAQVGSSEIRIKVDGAAVIIATIDNSESGLDIYSPAVGDLTFSRHIDGSLGSPKAFSLDLSNYLQLASLDHGGGPVTLEVFDYGLTIEQAVLKAGRVEAVDVPAYPIVLSINGATRSRLEAVVGMRDRSAFDKLTFERKLPGLPPTVLAASQLRSKPLGQYARSYQIPFDCESACDLGLTATAGEATGSAGGTFSISHSRHRRIPLPAVIFGVAGGLAVALGLRNRTRSVKAVAR
jgi:hypothetical protein